MAGASLKVISSGAGTAETLGLVYRVRVALDCQVGDGGER
jgi:hypothetical protein